MGSSSRAISTFYYIAVICQICYSSIQSNNQVKSASPRQSSPFEHIVQNASLKLNQNIDIRPINYTVIFPFDQKQEYSGCYLRNPEKIGLNYKKAMVPLRNIKYYLQIINTVAFITLEQKYQNPSDAYITVYYSFPVQPQTSIYKFLANFSNNIVEAVVKQKQAARKEFQQAKSQGRQAVIAYLSPNSKDIMRIEIGNVPPKTTLSLTISYIQQMELRFNTFYSIHIPSTISPRYMNTIPFTEQQQFNGVKPLTKSFGNFSWDFNIKVKSSKKIIFYNSSSHKLMKTKNSSDDYQIDLQLNEESIPNKDFFFFYTTDKFEEPSFVVGYNQVTMTTTILASFIPRFMKVSPDDAYEKVLNKNLPQYQFSSVQGEYIFIIDRSGSMNGLRMQKAKQALIIFLRSLPPNSYFNLISFGSTFSRMYPKSLKYQNKEVKQAISKVQAMLADMGGTQIFNPLENALLSPYIKQYPRYIFILTDGAVSNTEGVLSMARLRSKNARIFSIGIGNGASTSLITGLANAGRGKYVMLSDKENPSQKVVFLLQSSLSPVVTQISLSFTDKNLQSVIPNPKRLQYILKDNIANFYITYVGRLTEPKKISLQYQDTVTRKNYFSDLTVDTNYSYDSNYLIDKMSHFKVVRGFQNLLKDQQTQISSTDQYFIYKPFVNDFINEIVNYSVKYGIISQYTSFVAIGKQLNESQISTFRQSNYQLIEITQTKPIQSKQIKKSTEVPINVATSSKFVVISDKKAPSVPLAVPLTSASHTSLSQKDDINNILKLQNIEGYWNDLSLIKKLAKNIEKANQLISKISNNAIVITKLVLMWFNKQRITGEYRLIIRKAESWLQKNMNMNQLYLKQEFFQGLEVL